MAKKECTTRELGEITTHLLYIKEKVATHESDINDVLVQTTKTNGRVSKLEWWRNAVIYAVGLMASFLLIVMPVGARYITKYVTSNLKLEMRESIREEVSLAIKNMVIEEIN